MRSYGTGAGIGHGCSFLSRKKDAAYYQELRKIVVLRFHTRLSTMHRAHVHTAYGHTANVRIGPLAFKYDLL